MKPTSSSSYCHRAAYGISCRKLFICVEREPEMVTMTSHGYKSIKSPCPILQSTDGQGIVDQSLQESNNAPGVDNTKAKRTRY